MVIETQVSKQADEAVMDLITEKQDHCEWYLALASPSQERGLYRNSRKDDACHADAVLAFIDTQRQDNGSGFATFIASERSSGKFVGHIHCQRWKGPVPLVVKEEIFKLGSVWGLQATSSKISTLLINMTLIHLQSIGCKKALAMTDRQTRDSFKMMSFDSGSLLSIDLTSPSEQNIDDVEGILIQAEDESADYVTVEHWEKMWLECGVPKEMMEPDFDIRTRAFIKQARANLGYVNIVARSKTDGRIVGSASCQVWSGVVPTSNDDNQYGTVWTVYVKPEYRRRGVARALMQRVIIHWKSLGCKHGILVHASDEGRRVYCRLGFQPHDCVVASLVNTSTIRTNDELRTPTTATIDTPTEEMISELGQFENMSNRSRLDLEMLLRSLPTQLRAVFGRSKQGRSIVDAVQSVQKRHGVLDTLTGEGNWLIKNAAKMGRGFDMKALASDPAKLATKFDRLSQKYDHWHEGNRSQCERWVARMAHAELPKGNSSKDTLVLDVACGIGLQAGVLRLVGFKGKIIGTDISPGMITRTTERKAYDKVKAINIHEGLRSLVGDHTVDLVICTGAMELLDHGKVLSEFARVLKPGGQLWTSMQWEGAVDKAGSIIPNPTAHQNVSGVTRHIALQELDDAGFAVRDGSVEECKCAFRTPSPKGDGTFLDVPYLFIAAKRRLF